MLDMARVHEAFEASTDFTVGIEEEFAILDPHTLSLDHRFEELKDAAQADRPHHEVWHCRSATRDWWTNPREPAPP